ncbi:hypothetical protein [Actinoplanes sp. N902-109]|uniref:hypothetical protein n=1 Tax=Actinoplanes sp. (strain N902-109) TaxID=649831 RepID=UPI0003296336|nr:hypothetical protein [Actinoplanes sp. N902-109]AGL19496.1 hypothetical protein L083_5986 [Actinoplanes sp. N902-109]
MAGKTIADGYVELRLDDSKLEPETRAKVDKVTKQFGTRLNQQLKRLGLDPIDLNADPRSAVAAIRAAQQRLDELKDSADSVEVLILTNRATAELQRLRKQVGDLDPPPVPVEVDTTPARREMDKLTRLLQILEVDPIDLTADPAQALADIARVQLQLREVAANTTTAHVRIDADSAISDLDRLGTRLQTTVTDAVTKEAPKTALSFVSSFGGVIQNLLPEAIASSAAATPVAAIAAPMAAGLVTLLGTAAAGAILGGVGAGGIIGGLTVASHDTRVRASATDLKDYIGRQLEDAAEPFIPAVIRVLQRAEQQFNAVDGEIHDIFENAASYVEPLANAVFGFIRGVTPGVQAAVAAAQPVFEMLEQTGPALGEAVGGLLAAIADNGPEAAMALQQVLGLVVLGVESITSLLNTLVEVYGWAAKAGLMGHDAQLKFIALDAAQKAAADTAKNATNSYGNFERALDDTANTATVATTQVKSLYDTLAELVDQNLSAAEAVLQLRDATKAAADAVDHKTRVSSEEERALLQMARATNQATEALDEQGRSTIEATKAHEENRKKLYDAARAMGYTKDEANKLVKQYLLVPKNISTSFGQPGMGTSQAQAKKYRDQLDKITREIRTNVSVKGDAAAYKKLENLLIQQQALAKGISVSAAASAYHKQEAKAYADGGEVEGWSPHPRADNIPAWLTADEWVHPVDAVNYYGHSVMSAIQHKRIPAEQLQAMLGYADGGRVLNAPFVVNASVTKVPTLQQALAAVTPGVPGGGPTLDFMVRVVHAAFPGLQLLSGYRPGSKTLNGSDSYHGKKRASDWPASRPLAEWINAHYFARTKELITPWNELNIHNGSRHTYTGDVYDQHAGLGRFKGNAHDHWAMDDGGYLMPGWNPPIYNGTGRAEPVTPAAEMDELIDEVRQLRRDIREVGPDLADALGGSMRSTRLVGRTA